MRTGEQLREFLVDHLGPTFKSENITDQVEIFLVRPANPSRLLLIS